MKVQTKKEYRQRRHLRLRKKISGTAERPRMSVFVSNRHLYVQFIDDTASNTIAQCSTHSEALAGAHSTVDTARKLGQMAGQLALEKGIKEVVFDRGGFTYGGRVKVLADAAREAGLKF